MIADRDDMQGGPGSEPSPELNEMREQIDVTRGALIDKLETLEDRVLGSVENSVQTVKETVQTVKRTFDIRYQVNEHPWAMVGGSVLVGYVLGQLGNSARRGSPDPGASTSSNGPGSRTGGRAAAAFTPDREATSGESPLANLKNRLLSQFSEGVTEVQQAAVSSITMLLQEWLKQAVARMSPQPDQSFNAGRRSNSMARY